MRALMTYTVRVSNRLQKVEQFLHLFWCSNICTYELKTNKTQWMNFVAT